MLRERKVSLFQVCIGLFAIAVAGGACSSSKSSAQSPKPLSLTSLGGRGLPYGTSSESPWQPLTKTATSPGYGYSPQEPIKVGGGEASERQYLNSLRGPQGQEVQYERTGSCCPFEIKNSEIGGMLDVFKVIWEGAAKPIVLYLDMYDADELFVPGGLTARK